MVDAESVVRAFELWLRHKKYSDSYAKSCSSMVKNLLSKVNYRFVSLDEVKSSKYYLSGKSRGAYNTSWNRFMEYLVENDLNSSCDNILRVSELYKWIVDDFRRWMISKGYSKNYIRMTVTYIKFLINVIGGVIADVDYVRSKICNKRGRMRSKYVGAWKLFMEYLEDIGLRR